MVLGLPVVELHGARAVPDIPPESLGIECFVQPEVDGAFP